MKSEIMPIEYRERPEFPFLMDQSIDPVKRGDVLFDNQGHEVIIIAVLDNGWRFKVGIMPQES